MSKGDAMLPSPCVGVCQLDPRTNWCIGCGRSGEELFGWGDLSPSRQRAVWAELPARMAKLRRPVRVLPWAGAALLERLAGPTSVAGTVWSLGVEGASAEFMASKEADVAVAVSDRALLARHPGGVLQLRAVAGLRGFVASDGHDAEIVLALHQARVKTVLPRLVTEIGEDPHELAAAVPGARLFDLGLGCRAFRFCVRTGAPDLVAALREAAGRPLTASDLAARLVAASPARVVLSPIGRIEVTAPIAAPGGTTPEGPHTHLYLDRLAAAADGDLGAAVPPDYVAVARMFTSHARLTAFELDLPEEAAVLG